MTNASTKRPWHVPDSLEAELAMLYAKPQRAYHNYSHISEVLSWFDAVAHAGLWRDPLVAHAAILFHDAVYVAGSKTNEAESALLATAMLPRHGWPGDSAQLALVARYIELTARHGQLSPGDVDDNTALFLDCDTAILGAAWEDFCRYDEQIAAEYSHVPAPLFKAGRGHFLRSLLGRQIFLTTWFDDTLGHRAKANIAQILSQY